jgi:predicted metalloprotease
MPLIVTPGAIRACLTGGGGGGFAAVLVGTVVVVVVSVVVVVELVVLGGGGESARAYAAAAPATPHATVKTRRATRLTAAVYPGSPLAYPQIDRFAAEWH